MQKKFFEIAKRLSKKSTYKHQIGAVVVKKGKPIGFGHNKPEKTHPRSKTTYNTIHAEFDAILRLSLSDLKNAEIYIYREYKNGAPATAKPCKHCYSLIKQVGIKKVMYSCSQIGYVCENN